jgi:atypical dual specificity phosphatase
MARSIKVPVDALNGLLSAGKRVYVHCTAGICRAPGTVVGYLHKYRGMSLEGALELVKLNRTIANPYMEALKIAFNQED